MAPLLAPNSFLHTKDPCVVHDGKCYHIFGSGGRTEAQEWEIAHFTATHIDGPWVEAPFSLIGLSSPRLCAPGVLYDGRFHLFVQTECFGLDGTIEYAVSDDGQTFHHVGTSLASVPDTDEAGIYDPHPALIVIDGIAHHYLTYAGMRHVGRGDLYLARSSGGWEGPWERLGRILTHEQVPHHNQHDNPTYEWGLEGPQLIQLPDGKLLLNAVCFLPDQSPGRKQRVFLAVGDTPNGPYTTLGPTITPSTEGWDCGENGHASLLLQDSILHLVYQARGIHTPWRYGHMVVHPKNT